MHADVSLLVEEFREVQKAIRSHPGFGDVYIFKPRPDDLTKLRDRRNAICESLEAAAVKLGLNPLPLIQIRLGTVSGRGVFDVWDRCSELLELLALGVRGASVAEPVTQPATDAIREPGRPPDESIPARNRAIRALLRKHPEKTAAEIAAIAQKRFPGATKSVVQKVRQRMKSPAKYRRN